MGARRKPKTYEFEYSLTWNPNSFRWASAPADHPLSTPGKVHIVMEERVDGRPMLRKTLCSREPYLSAQKAREHPKGPNIPDTPDPAWARGEWGDLDPDQFCDHCCGGWVQIVEPEPEDWDGRVRQVVG